MSRNELVGHKYFEGTVDVTDPCYNSSVLCRAKVIVKSGTYDCVVRRRTEHYVSGGVKKECQKIAGIGIYLNGVIPHRAQMELIDAIGVDSGLAGFFTNKPDYTDEEWSAFCDSIREGDAWIKDDGFFSSSGGSDGCYLVYAYRQDGEITALEIRFISSEYCEASVIEIELNEHGKKIVHILGDSYYADDGTDAPYRFTEYCWGYIPLKEVVENGMPDGDWYGELKQYITDCTEEQLDEIYEHYDNGKMPRVIENLTVDLPIGCYIIA